MSRLDFLWIELTARCNLTCVHCYTSSHPHSGDDDVLTQDDYERVLDQAYGEGCRAVQFIGGEPQLNRSLFDLSCRAVTLGYEHVEIFSNLTRLDDALLRFAAANRVRFATSFYSDRPQSHDAITGVAGSHARTLANIRRLRGNAIDLRVGLIALGQDDDEIDRAIKLLREEGVERISLDRVRRFGRAGTCDPLESKFADLCGDCWSGKLCVTPTGAVYPCVMSRTFPVGDVTRQPMSEILRAAPLRQFRTELRTHVQLSGANLTATSGAAGSTNACSPDVMDPVQPIPSPSCLPNKPRQHAGARVIGTSGAAGSTDGCVPEVMNPGPCSPTAPRQDKIARAHGSVRV